MRRIRILESDEKDLRDKYYKLAEYINEKPDYSEIVECDKCECLIFKNKAFKGKGEIRERFSTSRYGMKEEYICYPYYCKIHKPKEKGWK